MRAPETPRRKASPMIRKLRGQFVAACMGLITVVLAIVFGCVWGSAQRALEQSSHMALEQALSRRGGAVLSAAALSEELRGQGSPVGLATIYRQLERLEGQGLVHKVTTEEGACYRYCDGGEGNCFLLRCESCGRVIHADCGQLRAFYQHLEQAHHFTVDPRKTVLSGLCDTCREGERHGEN